MVDKLTESSKIAMKDYFNVWKKARCAETNDTEHWQTMLDIGGQEPLKDTYTLTCSYFVTQPIRDIVREVKFDLIKNVSKLDESTFWQPESQIHCSILVMDNYRDYNEPDKPTPPKDIIRYRANRLSEIIGSIVPTLDPVNMDIKGVAVMANGTLFLKGTTSNESLYQLRTEGHKKLEELTDKPMIGPLRKQNTFYHMVFGRVIGPLGQSNYRDLIDYVEGNLYNKELGSGKVDKISVVRETKSFLSEGKVYKEFLLK